MQDAFSLSWWDATPLEVREKINQRIMDIEAPVPAVWSVENRIIKNDTIPVRIYLPNQNKNLPLL